MLRVAVVIILLFQPAAELFMPGVCLEEIQGMPPIQVGLEQSSAPQGVSSDVVAQLSPHSNESSYPLLDHCFCCCHHVVPELIFAPSDYEVFAELISGLAEDLTSPTDDPPDQPPRFS